MRRRPASMAPRSSPPAPGGQPGPGPPGSRPARRPWRRWGTTPPGTAPCPGRASRSRSRCGTDATNSLVPTQAATRPGSTAEAEAARQPGGGRLAAVPGSRPTRDTRARCPTTPAPRSTPGSGGSHGVPMEQSTMPPGRPRPPRPGRQPVVGVGRQPEASRRRHELGEARPARRRRARPGAWPPPRRRSGRRPRPRGGRRPARRPGPRARRAATTRSDPRRRSPTTRSSSSTPSPVRAEMSTAPSMACASAFASSGARSALFTTTSSGTSAAPISASTSRTAAICPSASAAVPSTTCSTRSARRTESSVERKASTSSCGSLRTKPTVSVTSTVSPPGSDELAGAGVERDEEPVLGRDAGIGQAVEQRRLAGVGVPDERELAVAAPGAAAALQRPGALHLAQVRLQPVHAPHQAPAVDLELRLARPPGPDATGLLAQRAAPAAQPGQPVAQQRQLDLGLALGAAGVLGEDVEDHRGAVDGGAAEDLLEVPLLGRRQLVVEDDRVRVERAAQRGDLLRLPPTDEGGRVGRVAPLHHAPDHVGAGAVDQLGQLVELLVDRPRRSVPGKTTPTRMIRSRNVRSMSVPGNTLLKRASPGGSRRPPPCARGRPGTTVRRLRFGAERHLEHAARVAHADGARRHAHDAPAAGRGRGRHAPGAARQRLPHPALPDPEVEELTLAVATAR